MAAENKSNAALVLSSGAAIAAAIALSKKVSAEPLDEANTNLLIAIAQGIEALNQNILKLIPGEPGALTIQGYPPNVTGIEISRITIAALNTAYRLPDIEVPDGFTILIKAWPTNAGIIYVAKSDPDARNINQVWPLIFNDFLGEAVTNADIFYISGTNVGDFVSVFAAQRGGG